MYYHEQLELKLIWSYNSFSLEEKKVVVKNANAGLAEL